MSKIRISRKMLNKYEQGNPWSATLPIVAEQPGMRISFIGIMIAVVLSFVIQGYFSQSRLQERFRPILKQIHPQLAFDFNVIQLSLREGLVPRTAIVLEKVKISMNNKCLMNSVMDIDQVVLPFSVFRFFLGVNPIDQVQLGKVKVVLGAEDFQCSEIKTELATVPLMLKPQVTEPPTVQAEPKVTIAPSVSEVQSSSQIQKVTIQSLEIFRQNDLEPILNIGDLVFDLLSDQPKHISLTSKLNLFQENRGIDFFSQGELEAQYREFPERKLDLSLVGHIREGSYRFEMGITLDSMEFQTTADVQHIPVYPFLNLMRKFKIAKIQTPVGKMWTSFQAQAQGSLAKLENSKLVIEPLVVEGEFGSIVSNLIQLHDFVNPEFDDFKASTQGLKLDQLLDAEYVNKYFPFIHSLGSFQGYFQYNKNEEFQVSGIHNGLQFIFSNQGQRKVQKIDNIILNVHGKKNVWTMDIPRMDFDSGIFDGELHVIYSPQERIAELQCDIDEMIFSHDVQQVMTSGGTIGGISMVYKGKWKNYELVSHSGTLKLLASDIFGIEFNKATARISSKDLNAKLHSLLHLQFSNVKIAAANPLLQKIIPVVKELPVKEKSYLFKDAAADFEVENLRNLAWKGLNLNHAKGKIQSNGGWKDNGELFGSIQSVDFITQKNKIKKWSIKGQRDDPSFEE